MLLKFLYFVIGCAASVLVLLDVLVALGWYSGGVGGVAMVVVVVQWWCC